MPCKSLAFGKLEFAAPGVKKGVICSVHDSLRADIHPSACGHLTIVGNTKSCGASEVFGVVKESYHQSVCKDNSRCGGVRAEETEGVSRLHNEGLVGGNDLKIFFDQAPPIRPQVCFLASVW